MAKIGELQVRFSNVAARLAPDLIHCHRLGVLPAAVWAAARVGAGLIYDAHELETERNGLGGVNKWLDRVIERSLIGRCGGVLCVSDSIADWYTRRYRIARPDVVRNIPDLNGAANVSTVESIRQRFSIPADASLFIYQGGLFSGRRIPQLLRVFSRTGNDRHMVFMGYGEYEAAIRTAAERCRRIHYLPAVPPESVLDHTAQADVGIVGGENVCLSYLLSLPNKLFEYLSAGIPIMAPAFPEMERMITAHNCGWIVGESDEAWIEAINGISAEMLEQRRVAVGIARAAFSWTNEAAVMLGAYRRVTGCQSL